MNSQRIIFTGVAVFSALLLYFLSSYGYYPGLQLRISGHLEKETAARAYWDYGYGFNELDAIDFTLSAGTSADKGPLGRVVIEPAGFKDGKSRGYLFWLVVPRTIVESKKFVLEGKHHWGTWLPVGAKMDGRQLALFPGSRIEFDVPETALQLYLFQAPQAGYARISSENAAARYINGFGDNRQNTVKPLIYTHEQGGSIRYLPDQFRKKNQIMLPFPRQELVGIKIEIQGDEVQAVEPWPTLRIITGSLRDSGVRKPVVIEKVLVNGLPVEVTDPDVKFTGKPGKKGALEFIDEEDMLEISGPVVSYEIVLQQGTPSDAVHVMIDGRPTEHLATTARNGRTVLAGTAATQPYATVIVKAEIVDWKGNVVALRADGTSAYETGDELESLTQRQFNWLLLAIQTITAALASLLICRMITLCIALKTRLAPVGLLSAVFVMEGRWLFWSLFLAGISVNTLFLLAEWPGSLTPDSIEVLRQARWLKLTNHHPYLYSLGIIGLLNFHDSPLFLLIVQMCAFHCLAAGALYWFYRNGLALPAVLLCSMFCFVSLPVNYFNITLWKDIPFAVLVLFWALFLTLAVFRRMNDGREMEISTPGFLLLAVSFVFLCTVRHNGLVYIPFITVAMIWLFRRQWQRSRWFFAASALLFVCYFLVIPKMILQDKPQQNTYAQTVTDKKTENLRRIVAGTQEDIYLEDYLAERMKFFVRTLGVSPYAWIWNNDMHAPPQRWFSVDEARGEMKTVSLNPQLRRLSEKLMQTLEYTGLFSGRFVFWNCLFPLTAMIGALLLARWFPLSAFYALFYLYQTAVMFAVVWPRWRYMYYLYLGGVFLLPLFLFELQVKRSWRERFTGRFAVSRIFRGIS